jgi:hypothetical protein
VNEPNDSERLVTSLCNKSFLSFWSYPMPQGKERGKELCDVLVVCDPDVVIFSIKDIGLKKTSDPAVGWERWRKKAIDASCKQIYGAQRWIDSANNVITKDGEEGIAFPEPSRRRVHRVAVALGSEGDVPLSFGDFGKGFVHVFDEWSLDVVMNELDTISDFVEYLADKESLYARGVLTMFSSGGEEDLLAFYLHQGHQFPEEPDLLVLDGDLWSTLTKKPEWVRRKEADKVSYAWDRLIQILYEDFRSQNMLASGHRFSATSLTDTERVLRVMAREDRFNRRMLSEALLEFLESAHPQGIGAKMVSSLSSVKYVFLARPFGEGRQRRMEELALRCFVARGLEPAARTVIGIATERPEPGKGHSLDAFYLDKPEWTEEDQRSLELVQEELGYSATPRQSRLRGEEYPGT